MIRWMPVLFLGGCQNPSVGDEPVERKIALWSEFLPLSTVEAQFAWLADADLEVNQAVTKGESDLTEVSAFVLAAEDAGVRVNLWPMLSDAQGRWPNASNVDAFVPWWNEVIDRVEQDDLPVTTMIVDLELGWDVQAQVRELGAEGDVLGAMGLLMDHADPARYEASKQVFGDMVADAQGRGFRVRLTTLPMVIDDFEDGDQDLQTVLDCPVEGIVWDEISVQVYRSVFTELLTGIFLEEGETLGADVVFDYGVDARDAWGERATLDLGTLGGVAYEQPAILAEDLGAARAAGFAEGEVDLYSLDGMLLGEPALWVDELDAPALEPDAEPKVAEIREFLRTLDQNIEL